MIKTVTLTSVIKKKTMEFTCFICGQSDLFERGVTVGKKGLLTLINASKDREDEKWKVLEQTADKIIVHGTCRNKYTHPTELKKLKSQLDEVNREPESSRKLRNLNLNLFNFKTHCLFCSEIVDTKHDRKSNIRNVATLEIRDVILKFCKKRNDKWGESVFQRICNELDLVASESRYHSNCYSKFMSDNPKNIGRPINSELLMAFNRVCDEIEQDDNNCQFSLKCFLERMSCILAENQIENVILWSEKTLKLKLKEKYGSHVVITSIKGKDSVLCLKSKCDKLLTDKYSAIDLNNVEERRKIVSMAASIIKEDIRGMVCNVTEYPSLDAIKDGGVSSVPPTLHTFFETLVISDKRNGKEQYEKRIKVIQNMIISLIRVKSFLSPVMVGIGVHLHRKYGSRYLIDLLFALGISISYKECLKFENLAVVNQTQVVNSGSFIQFVFDNADINVRTLDGYGTFHSMGGILCISPDNKEESVITKSKDNKTSEIGKYGSLQIKVNTFFLPGKLILFIFVLIFRFSITKSPLNLD